VQSSEIGTAYLVHSSVVVYVSTTQAMLDTLALATLKGRVVTLPAVSITRAVRVLPVPVIKVTASSAHSSVVVNVSTTQAMLDTLALANKVNKVTIATANTATDLVATDLEDGLYRVYTVDIAGLE
jgi:hypothetical protein